MESVMPFNCLLLCGPLGKIENSSRRGWQRMRGTDLRANHWVCFPSILFWEIHPSCPQPQPARSPSFSLRSVEDASWSLAVWTPGPSCCFYSRGQLNLGRPHGSLPCMNDSVLLGWNLGDPGSYLWNGNSNTTCSPPLVPHHFQIGALYSAGDQLPAAGWEEVDDREWDLTPPLGEKFIALKPLPNCCLGGCGKEEVFCTAFTWKPLKSTDPDLNPEKLETSFRVPWDPGGPFLLRIVLLGVSSGCQVYLSNCF